MAPEFEKPRVTEIQVRMDCNGCVQKIKKALHGINGIYDLYIDFPQQKLTIVGWTDPEKIVKALRKTRKIATICSHTEQTEPTEEAPAEDAAPPNNAAANPSAAAPPNDAAANPPPPEGPPAEPLQPAEPPKDQPPPENPPSPENPPPELKPSPIAADVNSNQQAGPSGPKDIGEVHVIHHHPPDYNYRYGYGYGNSYSGHWNRYPTVPKIQHEAPQGPQPVYVSHSYNTYKPAPYVTEYEHVRSPPRYAHYRMDHYSDDYHSNYHNNSVYYNTSNGNGSGNITSIFSDENPNACRVM